MTKAHFKKQFPKMLKKARIDSEHTQAEIAKMAGLSQDWLSHFEAGRRLPNAYSYYRLSRIFGDYIP